MELEGEWRNLFPLKTVNDVRKLFEKQLATGNPDLALLSIVAGTIENTMTKATEVNTASGPDPSQFQVTILCSQLMTNSRKNEKSVTHQK